ncbi:uncharacterized protein LOC119349444 isoform X2 [Triticum dicoccoides]|uniref:uncharacterized protein LOC119349444 isoform X2 n=1 Tax=Triticum dicoccoides TaxID=85692 RepID=UPI00188F84BA|nr:uncharacterized protein LOC119349444 isoform X2 [Triticum dicoccoides]
MGRQCHCSLGKAARAEEEDAPGIGGGWAGDDCSAAVSFRFTVWMVDSFFDGQTIHVKQRHEKSSGELIMCRCISPSSTCCRLRLFFLCWMFGPLMLHGSIQSEKKSSYTFLVRLVHEIR